MLHAQAVQACSTSGLRQRAVLPVLLYTIHGHACVQRQIKGAITCACLCVYVCTCVCHVQGPFSKRMLRRGAFFSKHFDLEDPTCPFISVETDPITKTQVRELHDRHVALS